MQPEPPKEEPPGYDPAIALKEVEAKDPYEPRLKPLSDDHIPGDYPVPWTLKVIGDTNSYKEEFKDTSFTNAIIVIKSLVWPGAYIFYQDNRWFNFYVGYGHKADQMDYYPVMPQLPRPEPSETPEQPEPNPKDEPTDEMKLKDPALVQSFIAKLEEVLSNPEKYSEILNSAFGAIDTEATGNIPRTEAENLTKNFAKETQVTVNPDPQIIEEFFKVFDKEKAEPITKEELEEPLKAMLTAWISWLKEKISESS